MVMKVNDFEYKGIFDALKIMRNRHGSVYFVSHEVIEQTHNSDWLVWNCGAILFLLLCGKQIYEEYGYK